MLILTFILILKEMQERQRSRDKNKLNKQKESDSQSDFDMFADEEDEPAKIGKDNNSNHQFTDQSGYYIPVIGTTIGNKYKIMEKMGKGVFGSVLKGFNAEDQKQYAIKIARKNDLTEKSGVRQYNILTKIQESVKGKKRILSIYDRFYEQGHFCIVCEILEIDLRTFAHKKQPTLGDIRLYAISMFMISHQLRTSKVIHADIKPDNFMIRDSRLFDQIKQLCKNLDRIDQQLLKSKIKIEERNIIDSIKLIDFGTSYSVEQHDINVDEQVARYYRAPEIILGTQVKSSQVYALDIWAIGCSLFQLYTNQFLFPGQSNNDMLRLIMQTKGKFSLKMLNKSVHKQLYFDTDYNFMLSYVDTYTKNIGVKKMQVSITKERELMNMLKKHSDSADMKQLQNFRDFLERCLALNPKDRLQPQQAMEHPFLHYQVKLN